ncbi:YdcF family protein [Myxacorys almedinensis]|uniref:DUF218 domain-containing protein n=1 Tax=Myxacorys almedinensis A TaxID=2690445 RepID=A0A8J7Z1V7_9CYAN|nr:YdcF family protein [Myxacorys almedinensis]NDJ17710.1 hypothetical protein [Myxacorys almedinensis A]
MVLLVTDVFVLLTQVLLWVVVGIFAWYVLLRLLPRVFLGGLVLLLLLGVAVFTFFRGSPDTGLIGDIWRIISVPFTPLGLLLILLLIALADLIRGRVLSGTGIILLRVAIPILLILSLPAVSYFLAQRAEAEAIQDIRLVPEAELGAAQRVIIVLAQDTTRLQLRPRQLDAPAPTGATPESPPFIPPPDPISETSYLLISNQPIQLTERGNRLIYAAQLAQQQGGLVVVSAGSRPGRDRREGESPESVSEAQDAATFLRSRGVTNLLEDPRSETVHDSAVNVRELLARNNIDYNGQVTLVTSAIEMPRAVSTFRQEFAAQQEGTFSVLPRPTDFYTVPSREALRNRVQGRDLIERNFRLADILPNVDALSLSSKVINEYITSIYYFLRGWIRPVRAI